MLKSLLVFASFLVLVPATGLGQGVITGGGGGHSCLREGTPRVPLDLVNYFDIDVDPNRIDVNDQVFERLHFDSNFSVSDMTDLSLFNLVRQIFGSWGRTMMDSISSFPFKMLNRYQFDFVVHHSRDEFRNLFKKYFPYFDKKSLPTGDECLSVDLTAFYYFDEGRDVFEIHIFAPIMNQMGVVGQAVLLAHEIIRGAQVIYRSSARIDEVDLLAITSATSICLPDIGASIPEGLDVLPDLAEELRRAADLPTVRAHSESVSTLIHLLSSPAYAPVTNIEEIQAYMKRACRVRPVFRSFIDLAN